MELFGDEEFMRFFGGVMTESAGNLRFDGMLGRAAGVGFAESVGGAASKRDTGAETPPPRLLPTCSGTHRIGDPMTGLTAGADR